MRVIVSKVNVSKLVECLNQQEIFLSLAKQINSLFVAGNHHVCKHFVALAFLSNLGILNTFFTKCACLHFFGFKGISFSSELEVEFAARFE